MKPRTHVVQTAVPSSVPAPSRGSLGVGKRLQGIIVGVIVGVLFAGGVAYAVTYLPPTSTDRYYACVNSNGTVEYTTLRLNHKPSPSACASRTDTIRSWNAQGPKGDPGAASKHYKVGYRVLPRDATGGEVWSAPLQPGNYELRAVLKAAPTWTTASTGDFRILSCAAFILPDVSGPNAGVNESMSSITLMGTTRFVGADLPVLAPIAIGTNDIGVSLRCFGTLLDPEAGEPVTLQGTVFIEPAVG